MAETQMERCCVICHADQSHPVHTYKNWQGEVKRHEFTPAAPETAPSAKEFVRKDSPEMASEDEQCPQCVSKCIHGWCECCEETCPECLRRWNLEQDAQKGGGVTCPACDGERVVMSVPPGAGHSDDLAEYEPCSDCKGTGVAPAAPERGLDD